MSKEQVAFVDQEEECIKEKEEQKYELQVIDVKKQVVLIQKLLKDVMQEGKHFGVIPGCGNKPTLLKAGAEKLCFIFKLAASFDFVQKDFQEYHREYQVKCTLTHIESGKLIAQGVGSASTMETKFKRSNIADTFNTVLKMAKKRAFVDATITATAASDIFTQDIEDMNFEKEDNEIEKIYSELSKMVKDGIIEPKIVSDLIVALAGKPMPFLSLSKDIATAILNKIKGGIS